MNSYSNLFQTQFKEVPEIPDQFPQYKLQFLPSHQQSFKELGQLLHTNEDNSYSLELPSANLLKDNQIEEDKFALEVEIKLRKYTSFENGFMENHRKVLRNSLQEFLNKNRKIVHQLKEKDFSTQITNDIKLMLFDQQLFTSQQISQNKERLLKKDDQFKILKEMYQDFDKTSNVVIKDTFMMGLWILKNTDHLVQSILHQNSFCIQQVENVKTQLLNYLEKNENVCLLSREIAKETKSEEQFIVMVESWLYTLLIAKLGYFQNDCFDAQVSLEEHLKALLKEEKRQHSFVSDSDDDDQITSMQLCLKKRKL